MIKSLIFITFLCGCSQQKSSNEIVDLFHDTMKHGEGISIKIEPIRELKEDKDH